jgi:hypothetical protein
MKTTYYKSLYILDTDLIEDELLDSLVMCGTQNWEHYYENNSHEANIETLHDVLLVEFNNFDSFKIYQAQNTIIDYSLEHDSPMVLTYGKD